MKDLEKLLSSLEERKKSLFDKFLLFLKKGKGKNEIFIDDICIQNSEKILKIGDRDLFSDLDSTIRYLIYRVKQKMYSSLPDQIIKYKAIDLSEDIKFAIKEGYGPCLSKTDHLYVYLILNLSELLLNEAIKYDPEKRVIYINPEKVKELRKLSSQKIDSLEKYIDDLISIVAFLTFKNPDFILNKKKLNLYEESKIAKEFLNLLYGLNIKYKISYEGSVEKEKGIILFRKYNSLKN